MQALKNILKSPNLWNGVSTPFIMDYVQHPDNKIPVWDTVHDVVTGNADRMRVLNLILNGALGAGASQAFRTGKLLEGAGLVGAIPAKDLLISLQATPSKVNDAFDTITDSSKSLSDVTDTVKDLADGVTSNSSKFNTLLGILGAGALLTGGIATAKYLSKKDPKTEMGKIKLKLPGSKKDPDSTAEVELPIDMPDMSPNLIEGLNRGVRLQARKNVRANSFKRDPMTGKLIPYEEWKAKQKEMQEQMSVLDSTSIPEEIKSASVGPAVGSSIVGTVGALLGGLGGAGVANHFGGGPGAIALASLLGLGTGGFGGAVLGRSMANTLLSGKDEEAALDERNTTVNAASSFANTGMLPRGYEGMTPYNGDLYVDSEDEFDDEDLDKYASAPPPPAPPAGGGQPPQPQSQLARRPVSNTLPPSIESPHMQPPGIPAIGSVGDIAARLRQVNDNMNRVLTARKNSQIQPQQ